MQTPYEQGQEDELSQKLSALLPEPARGAVRFIRSSDAAFLTPAEAAQCTGAVAKVRDRDVHAIPTPYFGGPAMLGGLLAAYLVATSLPFLSLADDGVFKDVRAVVLGGAVICIVGIVDDLYELAIGGKTIPIAGG